MNWDRLQPYGLSPEKSFEMLCNQLFENWCKETYKDEILSFSVVNGAGGDGGVESYAVLSDSSIIGLQAKWFLNSMESGQISQIRGSLRTAKKIRPKITRYVICIPRDLASVTGRGENTESKRWEDFVNSMKTEFPDVTIDLWNDTRVTTEIQKANAAGIHKFWFEHSEIESERFSYTFEKAKASWLSAKYVPDLDVTGQITKTLKRFVGDYACRESLINGFSTIAELCRRFEDAANNLISVCGSAHPGIVELLSDPKEKLSLVQSACAKINNWLSNEFAKRPVYEESCFFVPFDSIIEELRDSKLSFSYHFHFYEVTKILNKLSEYDYAELLESLKQQLNSRCILFLGNPGTGKTHGVSSFVDSLIKQQYHLPIIIQARSIPGSYSWRDIITATLGLSGSWSEDEVWQALGSAANRSRFQESALEQTITICPKVFVVVDGIDESATYEDWINRIKETETIKNEYPHIRFCFTSRPHVFPGKIDFAHAIRLNEAGDVPVYKLFDEYTRAYGITAQNCQWLKYALNTPLALKLFCELHQGQCVTVSNLSEVSMNQLWRAKIDKIQTECDRKTGLSPKNQHIFLSITGLAKCFVGQGHLERSKVLTEIQNCANVSVKSAESILDHIEAYGIVGSYCQKGAGLLPDSFFYYPGIQGYFDYASAMHLITEYENPSAIDFEKCGKIDTNTMYCLAVISIQQYKYLITQNPTIRKVMFHFEIPELRFYALQHSHPAIAIQFKDHCMEYMRSGAEGLITIVNKLVLPLSRISGHPLGITLLDEFLNTFNRPAQRDIVWSLPAYLRRSDGKRWDKSDEATVLYEDDEEYALTVDDRSDGLPIIYAWLLSNVSNPVRKKCRDRLMVWAREVPQEFFSLFLHFSGVNDPQILSDLYSILMCLVYDGVEASLIKEIADWVVDNTLSPAVIDYNRDISVRYYAIGIVEKAKLIGLYTDEAVDEYLPPYNAKDTEIPLSKSALSGTRMGGYSAIDYDLARYVLVDHFDGCFNSWKDRQLEKLAKRIGKCNPEYLGMTSEQFVISAAYAFLCNMGWNEDEFYNYSKDEAGNLIGGVDLSIGASYPSATHGAQSSVMTVCEKYVWAARNYISGFLCDRLPFGDKQIQITDYNLLDDFMIPIQEICQIDPDNIPYDRPWHIPEPATVFADKELGSKESISEHIKCAPEIDWAKWIYIDNKERHYSIPSSNLLALKTYSCFYGLDTETCLFINSIVVPSDEVSEFVLMSREENRFQNVCDPSDWDGGVDASCYITPKEICWFPWKKHYDSYKAEEYPNISIHSAVESCCYNFTGYSDVYYSMPSTILRTLMGIVDTDGYHYFDKDKNIISEFSISGEKWRTTQEFVLVDEGKIENVLSANGLSLIWIMQEMRRETGNAKEKFGEFFVEKRRYYIGYFANGNFVTEQMLTEFSENLY